MTESPIVRTILGDIPPSELGVCYAHEHIVIDRGYATDRHPAFLLNDPDRIVRELRAFRAAGGASMIDSMPCDCGRNAALQAEVSRMSGVRIVVPTGLHLPQYYDSGHWSFHYNVDQLAALFAADVCDGIDRYDYSGPLVERLEHRAGLIKIATGPAFTPREERIFAAAAEAHRRTGVPILTHTEQGELGMEQAERLSALGVDLSRVTLSHLDRKPDPAYHREVLSTGVNLEYDSAFRWKRETNPTRDLLLELYPEFPSQLMLGMDAARSAYWKAYGGSPGLTFLLDTFRPQLLHAGLAEADLQAIFVANPARAYAFVPLNA